MAFAASGVQHHVAVDVEAGNEERRRALEEDEADLLWAAIEERPFAKRRNLAIVLPDPDCAGDGTSGGGGAGEGKVVDVRRLDRPGVQRVLRRALGTADLDNANLLHGIKARFDAYGNSALNLFSY
jgi:hypothetical protein